MTDRKLQHVIHSAHVSNVNAVIILFTQGGMVPRMSKTASRRWSICSGGTLRR